MQGLVKRWSAGCRCAPPISAPGPPYMERPRILGVFSRYLEALPVKLHFTQKMFPLISLASISALVYSFRGVNLNKHFAKTFNDSKGK